MGAGLNWALGIGQRAVVVHAFASAEGLLCQPDATTLVLYCLQGLVGRFLVAEAPQPAHDEAVHGSGSSSSSEGGEATPVSEMAAAPEALCSAGQDSASWLAAQQPPQQAPQQAPASVQGSAGGAGTAAGQQPSRAAGSNPGKQERGRQQERQNESGSLAAAAGGGGSRKRSSSQAAPAAPNSGAPAPGSRAPQRPVPDVAVDTAAAAANKALAGARKRGSRSSSWSRQLGAGQGAAAEWLVPHPSPAGQLQQQQAMVEEMAASACGSCAESMDSPLCMAAEAAGSSQAASPVAGAAPVSAAAVDDSGLVVEAVAPSPVGSAAMDSASQSCPQHEAASLSSSGNQRSAADESAQAEAVWQQCALDSCAASLPAAATPTLPDSYAAQASSSRPQSAAEGSVCSEGSAHSSLSEGSSWSVPEKPSAYGLPYNFGRNALIFHWQDPSEYACCAAAAPVVPPAARVKAAKWRADAMRQRLQSASS